MEKYYNLLIKQYLQSIGYVDRATDEITVSELSDWILARQKHGEVYLNFVKELVGPEKIFVDGVEVRKGGLDTITNNNSIAMISEYPYGLSKRVVNGKFLVQNGLPKVRCADGSIQTILAYFNYITQNPYDINYLQGLDSLHNLGEYITVGIFGSTHDLDIEKKIGEITYFEDKLYEPFISEGGTLGDTYFYAVTSKPKTRTLKK